MCFQSIDCGIRKTTYCKITDKISLNTVCWCTILFMCSEIELLYWKRKRNLKKWQYRRKYRIKVPNQKRSEKRMSKTNQTNPETNQKSVCQKKKKNSKAATHKIKEINTERNMMCKERSVHLVALCLSQTQGGIFTTFTWKLEFKLPEGTEASAGSFIPSPHSFGLQPPRTRATGRYTPI